MPEAGYISDVANENQFLPVFRVRYGAMCHEKFIFTQEGIHSKIQFIIHSKLGLAVLFT